MENCCDLDGELAFRLPDKCEKTMFGEGFPTNPLVFVSKPSPPTALDESLGYGSGIHHLQPNSSTGFLGAYRNPATVTGFLSAEAAILDYFGCGTSDGYHLGIEDIFSDNDVVGSCLSEGGTVEGANGEWTMPEMPYDHQEMCFVRGGDDGSIGHSLGIRNQVRIRRKGM